MDIKIMETVYIGRDNKLNLLLKTDDVVQDLTNVHKMELLYKESYYDSDNFPASFDYATQATAGIVTLDVGSIGLESGRDKNAELIIYDASNASGVIWGTFDLKVIELEGTEVTP